MMIVTGIVCLLAGICIGYCLGDTTNAYCFKCHQTVKLCDCRSYTIPDRKPRPGELEIQEDIKKGPLW